MSDRRLLAAVALALGIGAALARTPAPPGRADVRALAADVVREADHVTALELAAWIKDRKPGLQVIDVRTQAEYDTFHVPTAQWLPLEQVVATPLDRRDTLVLYSEGGAHAAQAWVMLRMRGYEHVYFLRGGLNEWLDDVMNPERPSELTRYFGGQKRQPGDPPMTVERLRRRGC